MQERRIPITTTYPECRRDLRVPDHLLGTLVRCPRCRTEFTSQQEGTPSSLLPVAGPVGDVEFMLGHQAVFIGTNNLREALLFFGAICLKQLRSFGMVVGRHFTA